VSHFVFFFSSRRRHTRSKRDWSSDVCSSDLDVNENLLTHDLKLWENGSMYISNGKQVSSERRVRTKDYIELIPYTTYTISNANAETGYIAYHLYDEKGVWLRGESGERQLTFTAGEDETHLRVVMGRADDEEINPSDVGILIR